MIFKGFSERRIQYWSILNKKFPDIYERFSKIVPRSCLPLKKDLYWLKNDFRLALIDRPEPDHPLRSDVAQEFQTDHAKFLKVASEFTKKHAEPR